MRGDWRLPADLLPDLSRAPLLIALLIAAALALAPRPAELWEITAYTHSGRPTASGLWPAPGMAACPPELELGTRVRLEGRGILICRDRGGAIRGRRLDLFLESREEAIRWGRKRLEVEILE